jgi:hypothetical protein
MPCSRQQDQPEQRLGLRARRDRDRDQRNHAVDRLQDPEAALERLLQLQERDVRSAERDRTDDPREQGRDQRLQRRVVAALLENRVRDARSLAPRPPPPRRRGRRRTACARPPARGPRVARPKRSPWGLRCSRARDPYRTIQRDGLNPDRASRRCLAAHDRPRPVLGAPAGSLCRPRRRTELRRRAEAAPAPRSDR